MSLSSWLFGRTEADALRDEVAYLREQIEKQAAAHMDERKRLSADNSRLRQEIISLCNAGARAQLEAYRQQNKVVPAAPASTEKPVPDDQRWLQDYAADNALPPDALPTDEEMRVEEQIRTRERLRLEAALRGSEPAGEPETTPELVDA